MIVVDVNATYAIVIPKVLTNSTCEAVSFTNRLCEVDGIAGIEVNITFNESFLTCCGVSSLGFNGVGTTDCEARKRKTP